MTSKNDTNSDNVMLQTVVDSLDQSIEHLDAHTLSRLNQARHQSLATGERPRLLKPSPITVGTFALLFVSVMTGWLLFSAPDRTHPSTDEFELVAANEDFELVQNLDFFVWMLEQDNAG
jgi:hypothetical protein